MNLNQLINMVIRIFVRKAVNKGINVGMNKAGKMGKNKRQVGKTRPPQDNQHR